MLVLKLFERNTIIFNYQHKGCLFRHCRVEMVTCEVAQLWNEHGRAGRRLTRRTTLLHMAYKQHLVPVSDVQVILLGKQNMNM